jgi:diphthamide biosynthesis enzyme Dph1/Dph2-like protein
MKTLFIPALSKIKINLEDINELSRKIPKDISIAYSIQYKKQAVQIKQILEKNHNIDSLIQVLGCSKLNLSKSTKAILLISDGKFHAVSLALETNLPVYLYNMNKLMKISDKEIKKLQQKRKASYINYLNSDFAGILVSIKPGQQNLKKAIELKKYLPKKSYLFLSNNINTAEFENFPQIQSWINTACPRLNFDSNKIINFSEIK